jgi:pyrroline-5-carboxylate reductase
VTASDSASIAGLPADDLIAFIGGGNMASAIIGGLLAAGTAAPRIRVAVRTPESAARLATGFGIDAGCDIASTIAGAGVVVLAAKPQQLGDILRGVQLPTGATAVSVAAGIRIASLQRWLGSSVEVVRTMPNTPAMVRRGVTGLYAPAGTSALALARAEGVMRAVGSVCRVDSEDAFDALASISGCGPAYFFYFVEALRDAGTALGLPAEVAASLAMETFTGSAALATARDEDVAVLRSQVVSKGGMTAAALARFDNENLRGIVNHALEAAIGRARELSADLESRQ